MYVGPQDQKVSKAASSANDLLCEIDLDLPFPPKQSQYFCHEVNGRMPMCSL